MPKHGNDPRFLCTLDHLLEMTTIQLRAFLDAQNTKFSMTFLHTDRELALISTLMASLRSVMVQGFPEYMWIEICTRSLCMGNFVLPVK